MLSYYRQEIHFIVCWDWIFWPKMIDCIPRKNIFCGRVRRTLPLCPRPNTNQSTGLTLISIQAVLTRSERFLKCNSRNADGSKIYSYEETVTPVESFQNSSGLWIAQTLVTDNGGIFWVGLLYIIIMKILLLKKIPGCDLWIFWVWASNIFRTNKTNKKRQKTKIWHQKLVKTDGQQSV